MKRPYSYLISFYALANIIIIALIITLAIIGCSGNDPEPDPNSFCIYQRPPIGTNAQNAGNGAWPLVNCLNNPYHTVSTANSKGFSTVDCECPPFY